MLKFLRDLVSGRPAAAEDAAAPPSPPPATLRADGAADFPIAQHLVDANGLPVVDWDAASRWVDGIAGDAAQAQAWSACERAWVEHLGAALGPPYRVHAAGTALLVSTLEDNVARATLDFVNRTGQRILRLLDGVAELAEWGHDILIVFDDEEAYYRYVAHYHPDAGEFAASSGMYIHDGCGHFVTRKAGLHAIEPVIAHELTHSCLGHLPIPAWLNEGIAVNTEHRLCPPPRPEHTPQQMHVRHQQFWGPEEIQQFWSGKSFLRPDEGNELSYDLARIIVGQFASSWDRFRPFVRAASVDDAGAAAAAEHLGIDLGAAVAALLEQEPSPRWAPDVAAWGDAPERGGFRPTTTYEDVL